MDINNNNLNNKNGFNWRSLLSKLIGKDSSQNFLNSKNEAKTALGSYGQVINRENGKRKDSSSAVIMQPNQENNLSNRVEQRTGSAWKAPQILKTNLMQMEEAVTMNWKEKISLLVLNIFLAILIIAAVYAGLLFWETEKYTAQNQIRAEIATLDEKISNMTRDIENADIFRRKVKLAGQLLKTHIFWTNFFTFLEENTLVNVQYNDGFAGAADGKYTFTAVADSYDTVYQQVKVFSENDMVNSVKVDGVTMGVEKNQTSAQFSIVLELKPEIFNRYE